MFSSFPRRALLRAPSFRKNFPQANEEPKAALRRKPRTKDTPPPSPKTGDSARALRQLCPKPAQTEPPLDDASAVELSPLLFCKNPPHLYLSLPLPLSCPPQTWNTGARQLFHERALVAEHYARPLLGDDLSSGVCCLLYIVYRFQGTEGKNSPSLDAWKTT